jgi:hypothetical protein
LAGSIIVSIGAAGIVLWGIAHIAATKPVVSGFGSISEDNRKIITMAWVAEGMAMCFIGALMLIVTLCCGAPTPASVVVQRASAAMLLLMAVWTAFTGSRTSILPMKICPFVKTACAVLIFSGSLL